MATTPGGFNPNSLLSGGLTTNYSPAVGLSGQTYNQSPQDFLRNLSFPKAYASESAQPNVFNASALTSGGLTTNYTPPPQNNQNNSGLPDPTKTPVNTFINGYRNTGTGWAAPAGQDGGGQPPVDPYAGLRNEIGSAWDNYLNSLGGTGDYLNQQQTAQQGIADTQLQQGLSVAGDQKAKSLRDIANTTRNAFQAGNNYLGQMGAGDSSAANQYSFAINQQAGKQTGDLNNFVQAQTQQLQSQHDTQINQIAQWFAGKQQELKQMMSQGQLSKGQDMANLSKGILDTAMKATNDLKSNTQNQQNALLTWAANNSTNLGQLQSNIAGIPQAMGQMQQFGGQAGPIQYGGAVANTKTDIWGNKIPA